MVRVFEALEKLPDDPILGVMALFRQDSAPNKVDLSAGVYKDGSGNTPVMQAVKAAEQRILERETSKAYLGMAGNLDYNEAMQALIFGADHMVLSESRVRTLQTPGGSGGLRVAAEFLNQVRPGHRVWVSDPTWPNHGPLIGSAGLELAEYPYYDADSASVRFDAMMARLRADAQPGDCLLLHGCCHNPTGADLSFDQWREVSALCEERDLIPFVDFAYQGFGRGLNEDARGARYLAEHAPEMIVVASCSKNFGLYRERIGTLSVIGRRPSAAEAAYTHMLRIVRRMYSMPPDHGAAIVAEILGDEGLRQSWETELSTYRERMMSLRGLLADALAPRVDDDYEYLRNQSGMFSFLKTTPKQVARMRGEHHVYLVDSGRINVAGMSEDSVVAIAEALRDTAD